MYVLETVNSGLPAVSFSTMESLTRQNSMLIMHNSKPSSNLNAKHCAQLRR